MHSAFYIGIMISYQARKQLLAKNFVKVYTNFKLLNVRGKRSGYVVMHIESVKFESHCQVEFKIVHGMHLPTDWFIAFWCVFFGENA